MTVIENLHKLQNRAAKHVTNNPFDATALPVIRALQWLTVRELIDFESQKMVLSLNPISTGGAFFTPPTLFYIALKRLVDFSQI